MENEDTPDKRSIFDLNAEEREARLRPATDKVVRDLFAKGLPLTYQDDRCLAEDHFIQEYEDGRVHLVSFDIYSRKAIVIKDLTRA
jgi:hypothetical protein